jgi:TPR repeat protein
MQSFCQIRWLSPVNLYLALISMWLGAGCAAHPFTVDSARVAAAHGDSHAQYFLGRMYAKGEGVPRDDARAVEFFRQAAEAGEAAAQSDLGAFCAQGRGTPQDYQEAVKWFRLAAAQGDSIAEYSLGLSYELGNGVPTNMDLALKWYQRAAEGGMLEAQLQAGEIHLGRRGVPADYQSAQKWYRLAAAQHAADAMNALGYIAEEGGFGVSQDLPQAVKYYRQAALAGNGRGQANLGRMYLAGSGVPKDYIEAYKWFYLASTNGGGFVTHFMDELAGTARYGDFKGAPLTADQLKEAVRRAEEIQRTASRGS